MRAIQWTVIRERIEDADLPGFRFPDPSRFSEWRERCDIKAESVAKVIGCRCVNALKKQYTDCIDRQLKLAYTGRFIGCTTFTEFLFRVLPDEMYQEWETQYVLSRAKEGLCHWESHNVVCYCKNKQHHCPNETNRPLAERER